MKQECLCMANDGHSTIDPSTMRWMVLGEIRSGDIVSLLPKEKALTSPTTPPNRSTTWKVTTLTSKSIKSASTSPNMGCFWSEQNDSGTE